MLTHDINLRESLASLAIAVSIKAMRVAWTSRLKECLRFGVRRKVAAVPISCSA